VSIKIFYSWQSDLNSKLNRNFQLDCLKQAIKKLNNEFDLEEPIREDHDTKGVLGSPDIASTILDKINSSDIFIGDISFVSKTDKRSFSNPNVLIELGYAMSSMGDSRVINIMNTAFGHPKDLPFDLAHKRWPVTYNLSTDNLTNKSAIKKELTQVLYNIIKSYVNKPKKTGLKFENTSVKLRHKEKLRKEITNHLHEINHNNLRRKVIIRDVDRDDLYPEVDKAETGISPWFSVEMAQTYHRGVQVFLEVKNLAKNDDGSYRFANDSEISPIKAFLVGEIPYVNIDMINWEGDEYYISPQIYCHFSGENEEPYERLIYCVETNPGSGFPYYSELIEANQIKNNHKIECV
jgi:hypothetical protein